MDDDLPFIDEHGLSPGVPADQTWSALLRVLGSSREGAAPLARILRCDPAAATPRFGTAVGQAIPGFRIAAIEPETRLTLEGRHRFSRYRLDFELADDTLVARTHAAFPGLLGRLYKALVIGSGAHRVVANRMLRRVADAANPTSGS